MTSALTTLPRRPRRRLLASLAVLLLPGLVLLGVGEAPGRADVPSGSFTLRVELTLADGTPAPDGVGVRVSGVSDRSRCPSGFPDTASSGGSVSFTGSSYGSCDFLVRVLPGSAFSPTGADALAQVTTTTTPGTTTTLVVTGTSDVLADPAVPTTLTFGAFEDLDGSLTRDAGEPGVPGIAVRLGAEPLVAGCNRSGGGNGDTDAGGRFSAVLPLTGLCLTTVDYSLPDGLGVAPGYDRFREVNLYPGADKTVDVPLVRAATPTTASLDVTLTVDPADDLRSDTSTPAADGLGVSLLLAPGEDPGSCGTGQTGGITVDGHVLLTSVVAQPCRYVVSVDGGTAAVRARLVESCSGGHPRPGRRPGPDRGRTGARLRLRRRRDGHRRRLRRPRPQRSPRPR